MVVDLLMFGGAWLLQVVFPWSFLVSLALWWGKSSGVYRWSRLILMLGLGLIEDITLVRPMGLTSAVLLTLMLSTWLIARYYQSSRLWWWYGFGVVGELSLMWVQQKGLNWVGVMGQLFFLIGLQWWITRFGRGDAIYVKT